VWVERSETRQLSPERVGYAALHPPYDSERFL